MFAANLTAEFLDSAWDGKHIPDGQQCQEFDGAGATPPLRLSGLPDGTNAILLFFNDEDYEPLSTGGGHGIVGFEVAPKDGRVDLPAVPGGTTDMPDGVWLEAENRDDIGEAGYLAPCSGGEGNLYSVRIEAVRYLDDDHYDVLSEGYLQLGRY
ncbi:hypothetical protein HH303_16705 [Rhodospirillaceae bacterium KN72]|uniref:Uncharacterized protein n=1 Tax=Pacificispira spongiicola TaxID=2729598 RepID=A0A7Y0E2P3_9PROT|nr:hypothetical protein [Pacificispira spongiicola]NMM46135.1 hypothetical protein [Pacificispira spongiicola]